MGYALHKFYHNPKSTWQVLDLSMFTHPYLLYSLRYHTQYASLTLASSQSTKWLHPMSLGKQINVSCWSFHPCTLNVTCNQHTLMTAWPILFSKHRRHICLILFLAHPRNFLPWLFIQACTRLLWFFHFLKAFKRSHPLQPLSSNPYWYGIVSIVAHY